MKDQYDLKELWDQQALPPLTVDLSEIEKSASQFYRNLRYRNLSELAVGILTACVLSYQAVTGQHFALDVPSHWISRVGRGTLVLAIVFVGYRWWRDFRIRKLPDPMQDGALYIKAYCSQLSHQARVYRDMPSWYLAPFIPGFVLILLGRALLLPEQWPLLLGSVVVCIMLFVVAGLLIRRTARRFEMRAQQLGSDE